MSYVVREVGFIVRILSRKSKKQVEHCTRGIRIAIGHVVAEGLLVVPLSHRRAGAISDEARRVQMLSSTRSAKAHRIYPGSLSQPDFVIPSATTVVTSRIGHDTPLLRSLYSAARDYQQRMKPKQRQ